MTAQSLVLGFDGFDPELVETFGRDTLPTFFSLRDRGVFARLESVKPCATLPNWSTFLTTADPGVHGVFDFTTRIQDRVRFTGGTVREVPTIFSLLDEAGATCACLGFPATWPPEQLKHGVFMSGWDSPVAVEANDNFVWPPSFAADLRARFGRFRFDDVDEFSAENKGWHEDLSSALIARIEAKTELALFTLDQKKWDLFAFYFGESDTASHHLWALHDVHSPRHPAATAPRDRGALRRVYAALDRALEKLLARAGGASVELTIVSDHGSGGSSDKVLYLNRWLEEQGFLVHRERGAQQAMTARLKDFALTQFSPKAREIIFGAFGRVLPGLLESRARFGAIDFPHTRAFSDELNYFPGIWLNLRDREKHGVVEMRDRDALIDALRAKLLQLRDPWTHGLVVHAVHRREDIYRGPHIDRAPDLVIEFALDRGYSYNLMPSASAPGRGIWRKLDAHEYLGRKGRSLPGAHRSHGVFLASGPSVKAGALCEPKMADASATVLQRMGQPLPTYAAGRILDEILIAKSAVKQAEFVATNKAVHTMSDESIVEARLRSLGYID